MAGKVLVGSKLPHALVLRNPLKQSDTVTIKGLNGAPKGMNGVVMSLPYVTTEVDSDFWDVWFMAHNHESKAFGPIKSGALFVAKSADAIAKIASENEKRKTGLEPLPKEFGGVKESVAE